MEEDVREEISQLLLASDAQSRPIQIFDNNTADRIVLTSVLVGEHGFVPCENDINMLPEDRGRWWIMGEHVVAASEEASSTREGASPP